MCEIYKYSKGYVWETVREGVAVGAGVTAIAVWITATQTGPQTGRWEKKEERFHHKAVVQIVIGREG